MWVWEVPRDNHASYLFCPPDDDALGRLKALLGSPDFSRMAFLENTGLHAPLGFGGRVMHTGPVAAWWERVQARMEAMRR